MATLLAAGYMFGSLFAAIFLLTMAYRFVKAHERIADSLERVTRAPWREVRDPRP